MKKTLLVLWFACALLVSGYAQEDNYRLRISLLTCDRGATSASYFGHSAVRVVDSLSRLDLVFNYGTFDFESPGFMYRFFRGELDYMLSVSYFKHFMASYRYEQRSVHENVLNLDDSQKLLVYQFLLNNAKEENRNYRYDFMVDNCATRIRDIFERDAFSFADRRTDNTFRDNLKIYIGDRKWVRFGTDLILGAKIDRPVSVKEEMFLPVNLQKTLGEYENKTLGLPLLQPQKTLYQIGEKTPPVLLKMLTPGLVFSLLFLLALLFCWKSRRSLRVMQIVWYVLLGLGGLLICFLWFATLHFWCGSNWNLLWMNPLYLVPLFFKKGKRRFYIESALAIAALLPIVFFWIIPQQFNPAMLPVVLTTLVFLFADKPVK